MPRFAPSKLFDDHTFIMKNPNEYPDPGMIDHIEEPIMNVDIISPKEFIGNVMTLVQEHRGEYLNTDYIGDTRVNVHYRMPLSMLIVDFYDKLKSATSGFGSMNYEFLEYRTADLLKMDILISENPEEALATIVYRDSSYQTGKKDRERAQRFDSQANVCHQNSSGARRQGDCVGANFRASQRCDRETLRWRLFATPETFK